MSLLPAAMVETARADLSAGSALASAWMNLNFHASLLSTQFQSPPNSVRGTDSASIFALNFMEFSYSFHFYLVYLVFEAAAACMRHCVPLSPPVGPVPMMDGTSSARPKPTTDSAKPINIFCKCDKAMVHWRDEIICWAYFDTGYCALPVLRSARLYISANMVSPSYTTWAAVATGSERGQDGKEHRKIYAV